MSNEKQNPFTAISENLPFWPDKDVKDPQPFVGLIIDDSIVLGEDPDPTKNTPVFVAVDANTGEKFFIVQSYAIKKAVEKVIAKKLDLKEIVFSFTFKGKSESKGKPFNQFDTAYCTLQEYEEYQQTAANKSDKKK